MTVKITAGAAGYAGLTLAGYVTKDECPSGVSHFIVTLLDDVSVKKMFAATMVDAGVVSFSLEAVVTQDADAGTSVPSTANQMAAKVCPAVELFICALKAKLYVPPTATEISWVEVLSVTPLLAVVVFNCSSVDVLAVATWAPFTATPTECALFEEPAAPRVQPVKEVAVLPV